MIPSFLHCTVRPLAQAVLAVLAVVALSAPPAAWALYKVVHPDGRVTYTDRAPTDGSARVVPMGRAGASAPEAPGNAPSTGPNLQTLPAELRQAAQRHPVVLYSAPECAPCTEGRALLQQRGVPYSERRVASDDDVLALERLTGARTVPALSIGTQTLRGFSTDWAAFLDAAGYPRESRLPRGWPAVVATPLAERATRPAAVAPPPLPPQAVPPPEPDPDPTPPPTGIRF
ncbi:MAG: glutaredoxin family protein [Rubrivivax sp.]|jgi:glutaredoxin|nr:glutaredoxin family protein [Rubrivivax sp.]